MQTSASVSSSNVSMSTSHLKDFEQVDLHQFFEGLISQWRTIALAVSVCVSAGLLYLIVKEPVYQADAMIQVEDNKSSGLGAINDLDGLLQVRGVVETEIGILKSRMVLGKTVEDLQLDIELKPHRFPVFGGFLARKQWVSPSVMSSIGLSRYAWANEHLRFGRIEIPEALIGRWFTAKVLSDTEVAIFDSTDRVIGRVVMGQVFQRNYINGPLSLSIREISAQPGTTFNFRRIARQTAVQRLSMALGTVEIGRQSGLLELTFDDISPSMTMLVLNQIANNYVTQNVERRSAEAQQTLKFLDGQLPEIKSKLDAAESRFNQFRSRNNTVDIGKEGELLLNQTVTSGSDLVQLEQKRKELLSLFTAENPKIQVLDSQIAALRSKQGGVENSLSRLPRVQQELLRLTRDLEVNKQLYTSLTNNAQQLRVVKAGTVGNVRVIDYATRPLDPIMPKPALVLVLTTILGLGLGIIIVILRDMLRNGIKSPSVIESKLGMSVLATLPESDLQIAAVRRGGKKGALPLLSLEAPQEHTIESLRGLRTALHFAQINAKNNIIMVTGATPDLGKSFVSINLAVIMAQMGQRVLVMDADMRRGHLNRYVDLDREGGLSELITGSLSVEEVIKQGPVPGLDIITTGQVPPNAAELLMHERFAELLRELSKRYDHVIIDTPPALVVTDASIVGCHVGTCLIVARYDKTTLHDLELTYKRLSRAGVQTASVILNRVIKSVRYGYYAYN
ncbi:MAG: polysaccharide biosynthesis tyrosine autokinase [Pseudomonadota bacterium]